MNFSVDPNTLFNASVRFLDLRTHADKVLGGMISELASTAGMAGADEIIGAKFAEKYDKAARAAAEGLAYVDVHLGQIASGLLSTATNYWKADAASNMQFPVDVNAPAQQLQCDNAYAFKKEEVATAQGAGVDTWDVISSTALAVIWPQGDTDKMRRAGEVWLRVANALSTLNLETSTAVRMVTGPNTGETINAFGGHCAQLTDTSVCYSAPKEGGAAIPNLQALCGQLSSYCTTAADQIDDARETIKWMLIGAGAVAVVGVVLTVFTFGGSDVAAGAIDAAIVADAEATVVAASAAIEAEIAATTIAQIEAFLASTAVRAGVTTMALVGAVTVGGMMIFGDGSVAYASPGVPGGPGGTGPFVGPMPPLTPAEQAAFQAWLATFRLDPTGTHIGVPPNAYWPETHTGPAYDYQRRVAGPNVYRMSTGLGPPMATIDADGVRAFDGAIIDAKYTKDPSCSPYNLDNAETLRPDFLYGNILNGQDNEMARYTAALNNPANAGKFVEFIVNDPALVPYYEALMIKNGTHGRVIYQP